MSLSASRSPRGVLVNSGKVARGRRRDFAFVKDRSAGGAASSAAHRHRGLTLQQPADDEVTDAHPRKRRRPDTL